MVTLAVASAAETFDRLATMLPPHGIEVKHFLTTGQIIDLTPAEFTTDISFDVGFVYPPRIQEGLVNDVALGIPWVNTRADILLSRNKGAVLAKLHRAGISVPRTSYLSNPVDKSELAAAFSTFDSPVVVKPNATTKGTGVVKVHDIDSLYGVADYLSVLHEFPPTADKSYLIQEFLPDARDYRVMVLDGTYVGAVERRLPRDGWTHNVHRGARASGVELPNKLRRLAERVATTLDITLLGIDLLVTENRVVVLETNARPTIDESAKYQDGFAQRLADVVKRTAETGP